MWYTFVQSTWLGNSTKILAVEGDTLINGQSHKWLVARDSSGSNLGPEALVLEDTLAGTLKVLDFHNGQVQDSSFYDFSLAQGDTFHHPNGQEAFVADSVFTITDFNNITHKVIWLYGATPGTGCYQQFREEWIEGIGSTGHLLYPHFTCQIIMEAYFRLKCVFDSTTKIYGDTVQQCYVLGQMENELTGFSFYPNPTPDKLHIQSELPLREVRIYSISGSLLLQEEEPEESIDVSALKPGIFLLEITDQDGSTARKKLMKK